MDTESALSIKRAMPLEGSSCSQDVGPKGDGNPPPQKKNISKGVLHYWLQNYFKEQVQHPVFALSGPWTAVCLLVQGKTHSQVESYLFPFFAGRTGPRWSEEHEWRAQ